MTMGNEEDRDAEHDAGFALRQFPLHYPNLTNSLMINQYESLSGKCHNWQEPAKLCGVPK